MSFSSSTVFKRRVDEPTMSDKTLVLNIEDLISLIFGPSDTNVANFKIMQTVLLIVARQMRFLQQEVEIKFADEDEKLQHLKHKYLDGSTSHAEGTEGKERKSEGMTDDISALDDTAGDKKTKKEGTSKIDDSDRKSKRGGRSQQDESADDTHISGKRGKKGARSKKSKDVFSSSSDESYSSRKFDKSIGKSKHAATDESIGKEKGEKGDEKEQSEYGAVDESSTLVDSKDGKGRVIKKRGRSKHGVTDKSSTLSASKHGRGKAIKKTDASKGKTETDDKDTSKSKKKEGKAFKQVFLDTLDLSSTDDELYPDVRMYKKKYGQAADAKESRRGMGLTVSEIRKGGKGSKDTVIVVEKGPTTRDSRARIGSIDVVTRSQFDLLKADVDILMDNTGPPVVPKMPHDKKLKSDLSRGIATLSGTMEAMQVNDRVKATEAMLTRMAVLLTDLAIAGAFPPEMTDLIVDLEEDQQEFARVMKGTTAEGPSLATSQVSAATSMSVSHKSVALDPKSMASMTPTRATPSRYSVRASASLQRQNVLVTRSDLNEAILKMKYELLKNMESLTTKSTASAEHARNLAKSIEEKLEVALTVDKRVDTLHSLANDYAEQLSGFDSGLTIQLESFYEQMSQIETELKEGLEGFEAASKAESTAMADLRVCQENMQILLSGTKRRHSALISLQEQITEDMKNIHVAVETLREDKADRDEVADGLRDKADLTRLAKLVHEDAFEATREELTSRLDMCYEKFNKQVEAWQTVINDLEDNMSQKAEVWQFMDLQEYTLNNLNEIQAELDRLEVLLGEPKAAILTRQLRGDGMTGKSIAPKPVEPLYSAKCSKLSPVEELARDYPGEGPCMREIMIQGPTEDRKRICKRWVGGSHTMLNEFTTREKAQPLHLQKTPNKRYCSYGIDGRLYMMEEELQPCLECTQLPKEELRLAGRPSLVELGGGDQGSIDKDLDMTDTASTDELRGFVI